MGKSGKALREITAQGGFDSPIFQRNFDRRGRFNITCSVLMWSLYLIS